ncbi:MAG: sulfotransferase [Planctomycetota bacterium]
MSGFYSGYSRIDRALHRLAFATVRAQIGVADLADRVFRRDLAKVEATAPVLITALPRAGTTILLELLAGCPEFAAHTYRDMPFVLCPMMWHKLSRPFQRPSQPRERAHGDGIEVSLDSPEAFEEMIWHAFWPQHYGARTITPWTSCRDEEFTEFFATHRRKVVALRARGGKPARRYVSKNNGSIARVPAVVDAVPDATVLVAFREPLQHAASLLRQHLRFAAMHDADAFARRYMGGIGHFDFGRNLKPIDFGGWFGDRPLEEAAGLVFWLEYWVAAYRQLLAAAPHPQVAFVAFERLPTRACVDAMGERVGVADQDDLRQRAEVLRRAPGHDVETRSLPAALLDAARDTYAGLCARAL